MPRSRSQSLVGVIKLSPAHDISSFTRVTTSYIASLFISSQFLYAKQITEIFPTFKVKLYLIEDYLRERRATRMSPVINIVLCSLFPIKKYDKWQPLRWATRLACRHGRQPRLDQHRDVIRDVRFTVCAYWLPDYRVPLHNSPDAYWYDVV